MKTPLRFVLAALALGAIGADAQVFNLHLVTDNVPDYTDLGSFVESATGAWESPQDKCVAVWRWGRRSRRQTSCAVEQGRHILDPILHYNSYGAMNCGVISLLNIASWLQLGYQARYVQLGDHTVSEVSWDDGRTWHLFDSSMSVFCYNHEGQVASCEEVRQSHACELSGGKAEPGHYYLYHSAPQCASHPGPTGWRCASDQPVGYNRTLAEGAASYIDGFSVSRYCRHARVGHRYVLNVRPGESYTRYWEPLDDMARQGDPSANDPAYFRPLANGSDPDDQHGLNNIRGNGVWVFRPDLASPDRDRLFYDAVGVAPADGRRPSLHPAKSGQRASVTFQISAANVITSLRLRAAGLCETEADDLRVWVSRDAGLNWTAVWQAAQRGPQSIRMHLRDEVAGTPFCWIKFEMQAAGHPRAAGLNALEVTTFTQLNRRTLPALTLGRNEVLLRADEQAETVELWPALHGGAYRRTALEAHQVFSDDAPDGMYKATLGAGSNGQPCSVTWRMAVPTDIASVTYGAICTVRTPRSWVALEHSWDGAEFQEFHRKSGGEFPFDQQVIRSFSGQQVTSGARQAFLRAVFFCPNGAGTYNMPGLQDVLIRMQRKPRAARFQPLEVTYNWTEHRIDGESTRSHTERIDHLPHRYAINVAGRRDPTMNWVRVNLQGDGPEGQGTVTAYSDGIDVGSGAELSKRVFRWGRPVSAGKAYSASRPSSTDSGNPDKDSRELTNEILIAPTDHTTSTAVQPATAFWDQGEPVIFTVDLGAVQEVAGVRVATHQPNAAFCHPESIAVAVSVDGATWEEAGVLRHDDLWKPPGDYEPWEHDDNPKYARLPACGRLAYAYPLPFTVPKSARYVRFACAPLAGKGMGISELQVFDRVEVRPWPIEIKLLDRTPPLNPAPGD